MYRGKPYQRGSGFFSSFRYAISFLKKLGKETLDVGRAILFDIFSGKDLKTAAKHSLKRKATELLKQASDKVEQMGSGNKRISKKRSIKKRKITQEGSSRKKLIRKKVKRTKHINKAKKNKKRTVAKRRSIRKHRTKGDIFV